MSPRLVASAAVAALLLANSGLAEPPLKSGPPVGAKNNRSGFVPKFVTGPTPGERLCPV